MQVVINISKEEYDSIKAHPNWHSIGYLIANGTPLLEGHGRLGDLDELEQRIRNFVEYDAKMTDERTVARQRFIVDGIIQTPTIIEADSEDAECK